MLVSGVVLSSSAVALLARSLQRAGHRPLADDVGIAVDANWTELTLAPNEEAEILAVLDPCPALLQPSETRFKRLYRDAPLSVARRRKQAGTASRQIKPHSPSGRLSGPPQGDTQHMPTEHQPPSPFPDPEPPPQPTPPIPGPDPLPPPDPTPPEPETQQPR